MQSQTYAARKQREYYANNTKRVRERKLAYQRTKYCTATRPEPKLCECCGLEQSKGRAMCLDHCHVTGRFRGWLCDKCNGGIGKLGDNLEGVQLAIEYLQRAT